MISGTKHTKLSQNGRNPRPAGLPLCNLIVLLLGDGPEHKIKRRISVKHKHHKLKLKGIHQVRMGPLSVTNYTTKTQTDSRRNIQHVVNMTEQRTTEASQSQAGQPR